MVYVIKILFEKLKWLIFNWYFTGNCFFYAPDINNVVSQTFFEISLGNWSGKNFSSKNVIEFWFNSSFVYAVGYLKTSLTAAIGERLITHIQLCYIYLPAMYNLTCSRS